MTKIADIEPITPAEFNRMQDECVRIVSSMAYVEELGKSRATDWQGILHVLRETGCHPSVLARTATQVEKYGPHLTPDGEGYQVIWNRPKTSRAMRGWVSQHTGDWLLGYHKRIADGAKPYSRQWVWRIVSRAGAAAGIRGPVTPRRLRHTLGIEVTAKAGAGVARESLGVSEAVLLQYQRRTDHGAYEALKGVARNRGSSH